MESCPWATLSLSCGQEHQGYVSEEELGRSAVLCRFEFHFYAINVTNKPICYRSHHCPCDLPLLRSAFIPGTPALVYGCASRGTSSWTCVPSSTRMPHTHQGLALWRDVPCPIYSGKHLHMQPAVTFVQSKMFDLLEAGTSVHKAASGSNHGGVELHPFPFFYDPRVG